MDPEQKAGLYADLIALGASGQVTFKDGILILEKVFLRPGPLLDAAINSLLAQNTWTQPMSEALTAAILANPETWTVDRQQELNRDARLPLPGLGILVEQFLQGQVEQKKFQALPADQRPVYLRKLLDRQPGTEKPLFADFPEGQLL